MKKVTIIFAVLFLFAGNKVYCQSKKFQTTWGSLQKVDIRNIIGSDEKNAYAYGAKELIRCNLSNMAITKLAYDLKSSAGNKDMEFVLMMQDEIYFFSSLQDKKNKKHILYVQTVNKSTLKLNASPRKIIELSYQGESNNRPVIFHQHLSPDNSKLIIDYELLDKTGEILRSGFTVFDHECKMLWEQETISTGLTDAFVYSHFLVDNAGNVFFSGNTYNKKNDKKSDNVKKGKAYVILMLEKERNPVPIPIDLPQSKYPLDIKIGLNTNSELVCAGTFSQMDMNNALGIFSAKIDIERQEAQEVFVTEFDMNYLTKGLDESDIKSLKNKLKKGNDFENYAYRLHDIKFLHNGTFVLVAEKTYRVYVSNPRGGSYYIYYHGDIMVANFQQDASLKWLEKIPRDQRFINFAPFYSVGCIIDKNDNIHTFYNLMKTTVLLGYNQLQKTKMIMYSLTANGESSWAEIHDAKSNKIAPAPWSATCLENNDINLILGAKATPITFMIGVAITPMTFMKLDINQ
jgi:hypothetical protein